MLSHAAELTPTTPMRVVGRAEPELAPLERPNHLYGIIGNSIVGADVRARTAQEAVRVYQASACRMRVQPFWAAGRDDVRQRVAEGLSRNGCPSATDVERFVRELPEQGLLMARYVWMASASAGSGSLLVFQLARRRFRVLELLARSAAMTVP